MTNGVKLTDSVNNASSSENAPRPPELVYHTFFAEFRGATHEAVVHAIHEDSRAGTGMAFDEWWSYQKRLFGGPMGLGFPNATDPQGAEKLIGIFVKAGALDVGPKNPPTPQQGFNHG